MGSAKKTSENPHFRSKYADLSAVIEAVKHPLEKHGLTFVQDICDHHVVTVVMHEAGEQLRLAPFPILAGKPDAQGNGSALSYARRYSLQTALGVPAEDDDGNAANRLTGEPKRFPSAIRASLAGEAWDKQKVSGVVAAIRDHLRNDNEYGVLEELDGLASVEKLATWAELDSKERTRCKRIVHEARQQSAGSLPN
jgi:hypothetical protein